MDDGELPFPKEELTPLGPGDDPDKYLTHTEWNQTCDALLDVRDHVLAVEADTVPFTVAEPGIVSLSGGATRFLRGDNTWSTIAQVTAALDAFSTTLKGLVPASGAAANFLRGDGSWSTVAQVTAALNAFTDALQGLVPASGGGTANFLRADGTWAAPTAALFDTILTPAAITFGAAFDNWNPGALGNVTLIKCTTDASTRTVRGLQGGVDGKIVCLLNINPNPSHAESWAHEDSSATPAHRFRNVGGGSVNSGCIWYYYDGTNARWSHFMGTQ